MLRLLIISVLLIVTINDYSQQLAFPCAKGAGAYATGGRGGQVIHVTTLNWTGPGSLKEAIQTPGKRTIVFDVSGEIDATSEGAFSKLISGSAYDSLTIAGQTAPAGGITIRTNEFMLFDVSNIIIRYVRFRNDTTSTQDALWIHGGENIILDHCTFSHGGDEANSVGSGFGRTSDPTTKMDKITIQNCFYQDSKTGLILGSYNVPGDSNENGDYTFINNLISNISHRTPNSKGAGQLDIVNNVIYNWKNRLIRFGDGGHSNIKANVINNYYKTADNGIRQPGWFPGNSVITTRLQKIQMADGDNPLIYASGSIVTGQRETPLTDDSDMFTLFAGSSLSGHSVDDTVPAQYFTSTQLPLVGETFTIKTASQAYTDVLNNAGAIGTLNADGSINYYRDSKDSADVIMIQNDAYVGSFYDAKATIPYPTVPTNTRPAGYDSDLDGMADVWENATFGNLSRDGTLDFDADGYTDLEEFLNQIDTVCTIGGTPPGGCSGKNAPVATIATPLSGTYNKADTINLAVNYTSDTTVVSVTYYLNGSVLVSTTSPFTFDTVGLSQGTHQIHAVLQDVCGNSSNTDTVSITITPLQIGVCKTTSQPVIDGLEDAIWNTITYEKMGVTEIGFPYPDTNTLKASYKMMWDATGLYFFIKVKDDTLVSDSPQLDFFRDDAASIYIDLSDNNNTTYDADDYFFGFRRGSNDININFALYTGPDIIKADAVTTEGYDMEVKINWSYFGAFVPDTANPIGLDFRVDDDDNGGSRDHHLLWNDETSTLWADPSKFGVLKLIDSYCFNTTEILNTTINDVLVYPNPSNGEINIKAESFMTKVEVYNSLGALVLTEQRINTKTTNLNLLKLPKGIYSIKIYELNKVVEKQLIKN